MQEQSAPLVAMVDQIVARGIRDAAVLNAMRRVPRALFVPEALAGSAYHDAPLPIEAGQTISQPYVVALMIEAAQIGRDDHVLEIGAGSGYASAVMSRIACEVHAVERHDQLVELARKRIERLAYANITLRVGDGTRGWPEAGPFDAIIVSAGGPVVPEPLRRQLAPGGRLIMPVGETDAQRLLRITRRAGEAFDEEDLGPVHFVPLVYAHA
jgi:protein-L-isoaspartate(D-aspartate) O-methyltransferase